MRRLRRSGACAIHGSCCRCSTRKESLKSIFPSACELARVTSREPIRPSDSGADVHGERSHRAPTPDLLCNEGRKRLLVLWAPAALGQAFYARTSGAAAVQGRVRWSYCSSLVLTALRVR